MINKYQIQGGSSGERQDDGGEVDPVPPVPFYILLSPPVPFCLIWRIDKAWAVAGSVVTQSVPAWRGANQDHIDADQEMPPRPPTSPQSDWTEHQQ